jgi:shikimate dehydrogenase
MKLYGLIGYPLGHSFSKQYFNEQFEKDGLEDCYFVLFPLKKIEALLSLLDEHPNLKGIAVTIPYKQAVMPLLNECAEEAIAIGAVNCIKINPGSLKGFNTDVVGFEKSFQKHLLPHHNKALVLGTGGASKAVQYVLKKLHIPFVLVSRNANTQEKIISYEDVTEQIMLEHTILINCTPLGMSPDETSKPSLPYHVITPQHYLYDLVYKPAVTAFLNEGSLKNATTKNGFEMLLLQAEENWKIWNTE